MNEDKLYEWLAGSDTGMSSRAILAHMLHNMTIALMDHSEMAYPRDPSDLGRCIRLLDLEPSFRDRIKEMSRYSPEWKRLTDHWQELEDLYRKEEPSGKAPECYRLMFSLIHPDLVQASTSSNAI